MIRPLWTLAEIVAASSGKADFPRDGKDGASHAGGSAITGISIDTRSLSPGDLFVPLTDARDGHDFVPSAFASGAIAALVRHDYARAPNDGVLIRVDDPLRALECIGMAARARLSDKARVIAVTGSAGKTGTKEMLRACLKACASSPVKVHAPEKSFNNHWGVPLTLARMPHDTEFGVFEIGMNHAGEISPLTKMVRPHIAIVTNVLPVHVGNFEDGEIGVANAKAEIFEGLEATPAGSGLSVDARRAVASNTWTLQQPSPLPGGEGPGVGGNTNLRTSDVTPPRRGEGDDSERVEKSRGTAIILRDSPHYERLLRAARLRGAAVLSFGARGDVDAGLLTSEGVGEEAHTPQQVTAELKNGERVTFLLGMRGSHLATNALAALLAVRALGCDVARASRALFEVKSAAGRGARETIGPEGKAILLLDESYNANPASMTAALASLAATTTSGRRIAVLGDMLELGADSVRYHAGLKDAAERADLVLCCGPNMRHLYDALAPDKQGAWAPSSIELIEHVLDALHPGDAVMVKGSLGSRMAPIVDAIRKLFAEN